MTRVPDIIRAAYAELVVSDLAVSRQFYVDVLGLVVTHEDDNAIYLRAFEEYLHHSLVLRKGQLYATAAIVGGIVYLVLEGPFDRTVAALAAMATIAVLRIAAIVWDLTLPVFSLSRHERRD